MFIKPTRVPRIEHLWAALSANEHGEGVCCIIVGGISYPLLATDDVRLKWITEHAETLAEATASEIRIVKFSQRTEVQKIGQR